ncbi:MAG TPA: hypothetical protein DCF44_11455 [Chitinophagaceae bacterium]|nr:hypothetical protein [Chitinophagaceae bacterium]
MKGWFVHKIVNQTSFRWFFLLSRIVACAFFLKRINRVNLRLKWFKHPENGLRMPAFTMILIFKQSHLQIFKY